MAGRVVVVDPVDGSNSTIKPRGSRAGSISVLIIGETGVGKEVFAEAIWRGVATGECSRFVRINCAALTESLLESELFGHERGAFSGALSAKPGLLEEANGGTLLLDEVGELSPSAQAKLLRCLEDKQVTRVGALKPRKIDVRFIAATNRSLEADIERGTFRRDLYFQARRGRARAPGAARAARGDRPAGRDVPGDRGRPSWGAWHRTLSSRVWRACSRATRGRGIFASSATRSVARCCSQTA